ncbi:mitochondrial acidic protein MAM33 [Heracleum sosnowskyi]|uniref:Mitochondrial acidic protein MAM33 n=1 Tax=Heracleum sosnowskyi TaxID=360622 RepID=A0AAD8HCV9_9APIA|nr:mitochondrial acidic protein MAM33 [Heracleum sosnowskyi]
MWKRAASKAIVHPWRMLASRSATSKSTANVSTAVNSMILRSLKEHYLEVSKMTPPPKVSPPSPFTVVKGSLESYGPVLTRTYGNEEINISVMRLTNIISAAAEDNEDDGMNQLFLHVDVSKPGQSQSLLFLCGLYPDAVGIHSISTRAKSEDSGFVMVPTKYNGPTFQDLDDKMKDAIHGYIEERGINESLFPFLQAWLYVKDHRKLMEWFKSVGTFITEKKEA